MCALGTKAMDAANQARSKKTGKFKKKPTKKRTKRPAVRKVVVRREVLVDPYHAYPAYNAYDPFGYRTFARPVVNPHYHYYQNPPTTRVHHVSAAAPAVRSMNPADLFERVRAESAALRKFKDRHELEGLAGMGMQRRTRKR